MTDDPDVIDIERLRAAFDDLKAAYSSATPFPHVVLDDVLPAEVFAAAAAEFPAIDDPSWNGYLHINETKYANQRPGTWGPTLRAVVEALCSDEFVKLLGGLTGFEHLHADRDLDGGGLHQSLRGGFLNVHTDFTTHHRIHSWRRRINVLLYLNEQWLPEWGGDLELWDDKMTRRVASIDPVGNRMMIFTTSDGAHHGHPEPLRCPPNVARRSLALYYFTEEHRPVRRPTTYRPRPGDGLKGVAIWADRRLLSVYDFAKARLGLSDQFANRALGRAYRMVKRIRRT